MESSDSVELTDASDEVSSDFSDSGEDVQAPVSDKDPEFTCIVSPDRTKSWMPKCDEVHKHQLNKHFPTLQDAYIFF